MGHSPRASSLVSEAAQQSDLQLGPSVSERRGFEVQNATPVLALHLLAARAWASGSPVHLEGQPSGDISCH